MDADADFGDERFEVDGIAGFKGGAMFGANGLAFIRKLNAVLARIAEDGDETAGPREQAVNGPCGEDVAFADLTGPVEDGNTGGVVLENWDLVGAEVNWHVAGCARSDWLGKDEILTITARNVDFGREECFPESCRVRANHR